MFELVECIGFVVKNYAKNELYGANFHILIADKRTVKKMLIFYAKFRPHNDAVHQTVGFLNFLKCDSSLLSINNF